jgi:hypothetical protein
VLIAEAVFDYEFVVVVTLVPGVVVANPQAEAAA